MTLNVQELRPKLKAVLDRHDNDKGMLVGILQDVQAELGYLPREALREVHSMLGVPLTQVYGVATFFKAFSLVPRGRHHIQVCMGTACHVRGSEKIVAEMQQELGIKPGESDKDLNFNLETVNCVGACALGPIVVIDGVYHGEMKPETVKPVLAEYR